MQNLGMSRAGCKGPPDTHITAREVVRAPLGGSIDNVIPSHGFSVGCEHKWRANSNSKPLLTEYVPVGTITAFTS